MLKKQLRMLAFIWENVIINGYFRNAFKCGGIPPSPTFLTFMNLEAVTSKLSPLSSSFFPRAISDPQASLSSSLCMLQTREAGWRPVAFHLCQMKGSDFFNAAAPIGQSIALLSVPISHPPPPKSLGTSFRETKAQGGQTATLALPSITQPQLK